MKIRWIRGRTNKAALQRIEVERTIDGLKKIAHYAQLHRITADRDVTVASHPVLSRLEMLHSTHRITDAEYAWASEFVTGGGTGWVPHTNREIDWSCYTPEWTDMIRSGLARELNIVQYNGPVYQQIMVGENDVSVHFSPDPPNAFNGQNWLILLNILVPSGDHYRLAASDQ